MALANGSLQSASVALIKWYYEQGNYKTSMQNKGGMGALCTKVLNPFNPKDLDVNSPNVS